MKVPGEENIIYVLTLLQTLLMNTDISQICKLWPFTELSDYFMGPELTLRFTNKQK